MFLHLKNKIFLFLTILAVVAAGCRRSGSESTGAKLEPKTAGVIPVDRDLDDIRERGTLRAIVENSSTGFFIYRGRPMGYDHDLLNLFAESIGVDLEIVVTRSIGEAFRPAR